MTAHDIADFPTDTLVWTNEKKWLEIQFIEPGTYVWSRNEQTGVMARRQALRILVHDDIQLTIVDIVEDGGRVAGLHTTPGHPFWVSGTGWVKAQDLKNGDRLAGADGKERGVDGVRSTSYKTTVYNLEVEEFHTYFVEVCGLWVHDKQHERGQDLQCSFAA